MTLLKAELHVHLEGTITPTLARILAKRNHFRFPEEIVSTDNQQYLSNDFLHFLNVYDQVAFLIKTPEDYYDITFDYLKSRAEEGAIYVEMMYSPDHAEKATGIPSIEHLNAIHEAILAAESKFKIVGRTLITAVRHFGQEAAIRVAKDIAKQSVPSVVGFGLGGDELNFPPQLFKQAYEIAAGAGLLCTIHAGEFGSAESMQLAIDTLPIKRIGHGVASRHSPETLAYLKERQIALELCPTSNVYLKLFDSFAHHPLPFFFKEGVRVSINSDDPPFMRTTLGQEYEQVQRVFGFSEAEMLAITQMAIEDSFADSVTKAALLRRLSAMNDES